MKSKLKKIIILFIGLNMAFLLNNTLIFNNGAQIELSSPKQSAGYSESHIYINGTATGIGAHNWTWAESQLWCYGSGTWQEPYVIENVTIDASTSPIGSGILINNSQNAYFIVRNCTIFNADHSFFDSGIRLENTNNGTIINNNCSENYQGIYLLNCEYNNITWNTVNNNNINGIYLESDCNNNNITGNTVNENNHFGIQLSINCNYNNITLNTANNNGEYGIFINSHLNTCDNNIILNNTANENNKRGIYIRYDNNDNSVINNTVNDNIETGVYLSECHDINVTGNTINNNKRGIYVQACDNSSITDNTINDNADIGIYLIVSDDNVIKNNTINRNDLGIALDQSDYNNVSGNTLKDNSWCIYETESAGNIIEYNDCLPPTVHEPIYIDGLATGVGAHNWTWAAGEDWCSGSGTWNDPYIIENLKISGFGTEKGIGIVRSNVYFIIQDCLIYNSDTGIYLQDVSNSRLINNNCSNNDNGIDLDTISNNTISGNTANGNANEGITLYESDNNTISGNTANDNDYEGIEISYCDYNNITGNTANGNTAYGIYIQDDCSDNTISGNTANDNGYSGIYLYESNKNTISGNTANYNDEEGIYLYESNNNTISGNTANYNDAEGIYLDHYCSNNTISGNTANDNDYEGILLDSYCDYNDIIDNILYNNTLGILIDSSCDNNSIYKNFFLENGKHAEDDGTDNKWNSTSIGNYWDNWTSPDVSPNDGIVDDPYTYISGSAGSKDYLPIAEDGAPVIVINSPASSDVFGVTAPSFDVTITDVYVDSMWYTLDGGINNYTFIENGIINQTAWAALTEGDVTITFYAKDIIGNEASEAVTVVKMISAAGLDPGIIITIIVVSVAGGVAAVAVIYLYLKKRKSPK